MSQKEPSLLGHEKIEEDEDYEKAAVYRDFLHALEKGSVSDASDSCQTGEGL